MNEHVKTKKFRLFDAVLAAVCIVLVVESTAPAAAIGNPQFFHTITSTKVFAHIVPSFVQQVNCYPKVLL